MEKTPNTPSGLSSSAPAQLYCEIVNKNSEIFAMDEGIIEQKDAAEDAQSEIGTSPSINEASSPIFRFSYDMRKEFTQASTYISITQIKGPDTLRETTSARTDEVSEGDSSSNTGRNSTTALTPLDPPQKEELESLEFTQLEVKKKPTSPSGLSILMNPPTASTEPTIPASDTPTASTEPTILASDTPTTPAEPTTPASDTSFDHFYSPENPTTPDGSPIGRDFGGGYSLGVIGEGAAGEYCCWGGYFPECTVS